MDLGRIVARLTAPLARRVRLLARRAIVKLVYDNVKMQELQLAIFAGEIRDKVERWEDYGFTSHPLPLAEALVLALGGSSDHSAVVKVADRRFRMTTLLPGEVAIYDDQGQSVILRRGRVAEVNTDVFRVNAVNRVELLTPLVQFAGEMAGTGGLGTGDIITVGNMHGDGDVSDGTRSMQGDRDIHNIHDHPGDSGGTTGPANQHQ